MAEKRVILFGFTKMGEIVLKPLIREMTEGENVETIANYHELEHMDRSTLIDIFVMNAAFIGFEVRKNIHRITTICPEALLICVSIHELSPYICWKFVKNGVDIMCSNIDSEVEYLRPRPDGEGTTDQGHRRPNAHTRSDGEQDAHERIHQNGIAEPARTDLSRDAL